MAGTLAATFLVAVLSAAAAPDARAACEPSSRTAGGLDFQALCAGEAELLVERGVSEADTAALAAQVELDVAAVKAEFGQSFPTRPVVHVLASVESYATAMADLFGYPHATARWIADNSVAFFEPPLRLIAVNWEAVRERRPIAAIRHELTHLMTLAACAPRCDLVPAWLNEGQARLAEATMVGADWRLLRVRHEAASMAATGTLIPLARLTAQADWNSLVGWSGYYKYQQAARATELLYLDLGAEPVARLYARIARGQDLATAYAALAGRPFSAFVRDLEARLLAVASTRPGIATTSGAPEGRGVSFVLHSFAPESRVTVRIHGRRVDEPREVQVSPQGAHFDALDDTYPPGRYEIAVRVGGEVVASASVVKRGGRPDGRLYE